MEMQALLTDMLKDFHDVCSKHNLTYYALDGTALGVRRHGGFIPWDDDIDIGMPRQDYEKLLALPEAEFPSYMTRCYPYTKAKGGHWSFLKVVHAGTTLVEGTPSGVALATIGVYLDVFPMDSAGSTLRDGQFKLLLVRVLNAASAKNRHLPRVGFTRKFFRRMGAILSCWRDPSELAESMLKNSVDADSNYIGNFYGAWGRKEITPRWVFGKPTLRPFEDIHIYTPEHIDEYLAALYGDFMTPPPPAQRKSHHIITNLDLHRGFQEGLVSEGSNEK